MTPAVPDIRDLYFRSIDSDIFTVSLSADSEGILAGIPEAVSRAEGLGISLTLLKTDGDPVFPGDVIIRFDATPKQISMAEEVIIGALAKASGIATAARNAVTSAGAGLKIVSGAWKKISV